VVHRGDVGRSR